MQRPQHKSTPDPVAAPKNIPFGNIFIEFGDAKKCCTFSGLELVRSLGKNPHFWPSQRLTKLSGALSSMHKGPKCIQSLWDHPKKIPFVQKHKEGAICAILREKTLFLAFPSAICAIVREKTPFLAFPEAKKAIWRSQLHAQRSQMHSIPLGPSEKIPFVQKHKGRAICAILSKKKPIFGLSRG